MVSRVIRYPCASIGTQAQHTLNYLFYDQDDAGGGGGLNVNGGAQQNPIAPQVISVHLLY